MLKHGLLVIITAGLGLLITPWMRKLAFGLGAVDEPGGRRVHLAQVPRFGGLAVLIAVLAVLSIGMLADRSLSEVFLGSAWGWGWLLVGALIVAATGAVDDVRSLSPVLKGGLQVIAGAMALVGGHSIIALIDPFTGNPVELGWLSTPLTLLWIVGITNAFNLIDGLDGLAAGAALIATVTVWAISLATGHLDVALLAAALVGALAGFLYYNFNPASIFLGDSGSLFLGYVLSVLSLQVSRTGTTDVIILVPLLALGLPILETLLTILRRALQALRVFRETPAQNKYRVFVTGVASLFRPDQDHIHHRLVAWGFTQRRAVLVLYGVCAMLGISAFLAIAG